MLALPPACPPAHEPGCRIAVQRVRSALIDTLVDARRRDHLRLSRRRRAADLRRAVRRASPPARPGPPRAGRRACGGRLCAHDRQARRRAGDLGSRREQHDHRACSMRCAIRFRWSASAARSRRSSIGTDAFQECDALGLSRPVTKWNAQIRSVDEVPDLVRKAFSVATQGRPGPVLLDFPKDIQLAPASNAHARGRRTSAGTIRRKPVRRNRAARGRGT